VYCKNYIENSYHAVPFIKINGEICPIMTQKDYEIESTDKFEITSFQINKDFFWGNVTMILVPNYMKDK
jgi:hypothetical protein